MPPEITVNPHPEGPEESVENILESLAGLGGIVAEAWTHLSAARSPAMGTAVEASGDGARPGLRMRRA
jgi:hypothetical protein